MHGGNVHELAQRYNLKIEDMIDFSSSISPLGIPGAVMQAVRDSLEMITHYPDPACADFCRLAAAEHGVKNENILAGNGAAELIYLIVNMIKPGCTLIPIPTFSEYEYAVNSVAGKIRFVKIQPRDNQFFISVENVCDLIPGSDLAFVCNPNNPTGTLLGRHDLQHIVEIGRAHNCLVVVDEAYLDFVENGHKYSMTEKILDYDNLIVLKSLTKVYSLPGLRIGYAVGPKNLMDRMRDLRDPWSVNTLAQVAGAASFKEPDFRPRLQRYVWKERQFLYEELRKIKGLLPYYPTANFILVNCQQTGITSRCWQEELAQSGLLVRDCSSFNGMGPHFIRIAVRSRAENIRLIEAMKNFTPLDRR